MRTFAIRNLDELEQRMNLQENGKAHRALPRERMFPGDGDRRHGTVTGHTLLKCSCDECLKAYRTFKGERAGLPTAKRNRDPNIITSSEWATYANTFSRR